MNQRLRISPSPRQRDGQFPDIPYSDEALRANLSRLENAWEEFQQTRDREAVYGYLTAVFDLVAVWEKEGDALRMARRALRLNGVDFELVADPIAAIIFCPAIRKRLTVELAENGRGFCDTLHNLSQRRSQSEILFNVKGASTNVQPGMRGALDE